MLHSNLLTRGFGGQPWKQTVITVFVCLRCVYVCSCSRSVATNRLCIRTRAGRWRFVKVKFVLSGSGFEQQAIVGICAFSLCGPLLVAEGMCIYGVRSVATCDECAWRSLELADVVSFCASWAANGTKQENGEHHTAHTVGKTVLPRRYVYIYIYRERYTHLYCVSVRPAHYMRVGIDIVITHISRSTLDCEERPRSFKNVSTKSETNRSK